MTELNCCNRHMVSYRSNMKLYVTSWDPHPWQCPAGERVKHSLHSLDQRKLPKCTAADGQVAEIQESNRLISPDSPSPPEAQTLRTAGPATPTHHGVALQSEPFCFFRARSGGARSTRSYGGWLVLRGLTFAIHHPLGMGHRLGAACCCKELEHSLSERKRRGEGPLVRSAAAIDVAGARAPLRRLLATVSRLVRW